jgi:CoA-dependent NAD(P)H sulfur oxidoreductase
MALVVIGGVAAGMSAAARARRLDSRLPIVVLEKGPVISYGACGLPYLVEGRVKEARELVVYTPEYFRKERNIEVRTGAAVAAITHARREVQLESGERLRYEKLVIATGAHCRTASIPGSTHPHVFTLHTLGDAERMKAYLREKRPKSAVVVGAGFIGVEAADALRRHGMQVTVLEGSQNVLLRDDAELTAAVRRRMEEHRVELRLGAMVTGIEPASVAGIPCEMVVLAMGFEPNTGIAAQGGIEVGRTGAIKTDERMETNLRGVFAAGDCAEVTHLVTGRPAWVPLGTTANKTGRVAGANAAGGRERFTGIVGTSVVGIFGMGFATTGLSLRQARAEGFDAVSELVESRTRPRYFGGGKTTVELVADRGTGRLLGGTVWAEDGAAGRINVIAAALHARMKLEDFEQLDLAYSPPFSTVWDPLLVAAQQLSKKL